MRKIGTRLNSTITTFYFGVFSSVFSFIVFAIAPGQILKERMDFTAFGLLIATGIFGWLAQECVSKAL
jgi:hypothetical protein